MSFHPTVSLGLSTVSLVFKISEHGWQEKGRSPRRTLALCSRCHQLISGESLGTMARLWEWTWDGECLLGWGSEWRKEPGGCLGLVATPSQGGGCEDQSILIGEHVTPWPRCLPRGSAPLLRLALAWKEQVAAGTQWQRGTGGRAGKRDQRGRSLHLGWEHPCLPPAPGPLFPLLPVLLSATLSSH